jgi:hypothetical protein
MRTLLSIVLLAIWATSTFAAGAAPTTRPVEAIKKVVIISIDGGRPDLLLRADTPAVHKLLELGTFTLWARTTEMSITLPSHVSMLTGVTPKKHLVDWNSGVPTGRYPYPAVPTLFELARYRGYTTAVASGKSKFIAFSRPGSLDWAAVVPQDIADDSYVATQAASIIKEHKPDVLFVHFPGVDVAGHGKGWGSPEQFDAFHKADAAVATVIAAVKDAGVYDQTLFILTADHGGQGRVHGPNDDRSRHIPWIVAGPGVRKGYDLTRIAELNVNTEDTFATACWVLGIPLPNEIDGKPVQAIFPMPANRPAELLVNSPK